MLWSPCVWKNTYTCILKYCMDFHVPNILILIAWWLCAGFSSAFVQLQNSRGWSKRIPNWDKSGFHRKVPGQPRIHTNTLSKKKKRYQTCWFVSTLFDQPELADQSSCQFVNMLIYLICAFHLLPEQMEHISSKYGIKSATIYILRQS